MEDYDFELHYHPKKANVAADALSKKSINSAASIVIWEWEILGAIGKFDLYLGKSVGLATLLTTAAQHTLVSRNMEVQQGDHEVEAI